jgi:short-subunit dehydrogenase
MPNMIKLRKGNIINISSSMGRRYTLNDLAYTPSKAGLDRFSINLANDVMKYGIAVTSLCPGYVSTDMARKGSPEPVEVVIPSVLWLGRDIYSTSNRPSRIWPKMWP